MFQSMNEEGQQILENNISSLMRDLSVLRNSVPVGTFSGDLQQHHVVSRTQSCKVPLESGAHKGVRSVGAGGHDVSSANGRLTSTGGATRRHATFTTTQANRGHFDPDVSSASSEGPRNKVRSSLKFVVLIVKFQCKLKQHFKIFPHVSLFLVETWDPFMKAHINSKYID